MKTYVWSECIKLLKCKMHCTLYRIVVPTLQSVHKKVFFQKSIQVQKSAKRLGFTKATLYKKKVKYIVFFFFSFSNVSRWHWSFVGLFRRYFDWGYLIKAANGNSNCWFDPPRYLLNKIFSKVCEKGCFFIWSLDFSFNFSLR